MHKEIDLENNIERAQTHGFAMIVDEAFRNIAAGHLMRAVYQQIQATGKAD